MNVCYIITRVLIFFFLGWQQWVSSASPFKQLHANTLTGIWDFEPRCCCQDPLACVRAGVEAILVDLRWENISHGEDEAQQPGDQDRHDDLGAEQDKAEELTAAHFQSSTWPFLLNDWTNILGSVLDKQEWANKTSFHEIKLSKSCIFTTLISHSIYTSTKLWNFFKHMTNDTRWLMCLSKQKWKLTFSQKRQSSFPFLCISQLQSFLSVLVNWLCPQHHVFMTNESHFSSQWGAAQWVINDIKEIDLKHLCFREEIRPQGSL